jgi:hypothetical protein
VASFVLSASGSVLPGFLCAAKGRPAQLPETSSALKLTNSPGFLLIMGVLEVSMREVEIFMREVETFMREVKIFIREVEVSMGEVKTFMREVEVFMDKYDMIS